MVPQNQFPHHFPAHYIQLTIENKYKFRISFRQRMISQDKIEKIFQIFSSADPKPKTELEYSNNLTLTIAVILSAQATDISVNKATKKLFEQYDTPHKIFFQRLFQLLVQLN